MAGVTAAPTTPLRTDDFSDILSVIGVAISFVCPRPPALSRRTRTKIPGL
jgi:hypothetical protein